MRRQLVLECAAAVALTLAAIVCLAPRAGAGDLLVTGAFARASASPLATNAAAYFTITNNGSTADRLTALETHVAAAAALHKTVAEGQVMKMEMLEALDIPQQSTITLKPGGMHVMLTGLKAPLKAGESFKLDLTFDKAGLVEVTVPVGGVADQVPPASGG
jgi:periplasmic copper chaperone A